MKQLESRKVTIGENNFYIRPLPAFKAANMGGELAGMLAPIFAGLVPLAGAVGEDKGLFDIEIEDAAPALSNAFSSLSGDKLEKLLKHLLVGGGNISIEAPGEKAQLLTEDLANEVFCEDVQDMFILAFEVIRTNYNGFFKKLGGPFGQLMEGLMKKGSLR